MISEVILHLCYKKIYFDLHDPNIFTLLSKRIYIYKGIRLIVKRGLGIGGIKNRMLNYTQSRLTEVFKCGSNSSRNANIG